MHYWPPRSDHNFVPIMSGRLSPTHGLYGPQNATQNSLKSTSHFYWKNPVTLRVPVGRISLSIGFGIHRVVLKQIPADNSICILYSEMETICIGTCWQKHRGRVKKYSAHSRSSVHCYLCFLLYCLIIKYQNSILCIYLFKYCNKC